MHTHILAKIVNFTYPYIYNFCFISYIPKVLQIFLIPDRKPVLWIIILFTMWHCLWVLKFIFFIFSFEYLHHDVYVGIASFKKFCLGVHWISSICKRIYKFFSKFKKHLVILYIFIWYHSLPPYVLGL